MFSDLKSFEFDIDRRMDSDASTTKIIALLPVSNAVDDEDTIDEMTFFIRHLRN